MLPGPVKSLQINNPGLGIQAIRTSHRQLGRHLSSHRSMSSTTSHVPRHITVDVNVTDDSGGGVYCSASLYWLFDLDNELDYYYIELTDGVGSVTFTDLDPERTFIVELFVRDESWNYGYDNREGYPNCMRVVVSA